MKKTGRFTALIMAAAIALSLAPPVFAALETEGNCGAPGNETGVTWAFAGGKLSLSGSGAMADYAAGTAPWFGYSDEVTSVTVDEGITNVGNFALSGLENMVSVVLPEDSLTSVGASAFSGSGITEIDIPDTVTAIGGSAFAGTALEEVNLPDALKTIETATFSGCESLVTVSFPAQLTGIGVRAFSGCKELTAVTLPAQLNSVGASAFRGCEALTAVAFPAGVTSVGTYAFSDCENLSLIKFEGNAPFSVADTAFFGVSDEGKISYNEGRTGFDDEFLDSLGLADAWEVEEVTAPDTKNPILYPGAAERTGTSSATVVLMSSENARYYYAVIADGDDVPEIGMSGAGIPIGQSETTLPLSVLPDEGVCHVYLAAKDAAGNVSDTVKVTIPAYNAPPPDTTPPALASAGAVRVSDETAAVKFTSSEAGSYYFYVASDGAANNINTSAGGIACGVAETTVNLSGLTPGAKDVYIAVKDAAGNISASLKIDLPAYAAPPADSLPPRVALSAVKRAGHKEASVAFRSSEAGTYYYAVTKPGEPVPEIDAGGAGDSVGLDERTINLTTLSEGPWNVYIVLKDLAGNVSSPFLISVPEYIEDTEKPLLAPGEVIRISDTIATVGFSSTEAGRYYYVAAAAGSAEPQVNTSGDGIACGTGRTSIQLPNLTAGAKDIYIAVKDAAGNVSDALKIAIPAFAPPVPVNYTLTLSAGTGGRITAGTGGQYAAGAFVSISAAPDAGYAFEAWTSSAGGAFGSSAGSSTVFTMPANAVTVTANFKKVPIPVTGVSLNVRSLTLAVGKNELLTASVAPSNADNKAVTWSTSDASVASVDASGRVTAVKTGTATVTVSAADGGFKAECSVTVANMAVTGVTLNKQTLALNVGGSETLAATVAPSEAADRSVVWTSGDASVAVVDNSGKVTAVKAGSAVISATTADGGFKAECAVTVTAPTVAVTGVSVNKTSLSLEAGKTETLTAAVAPSDATSKGVAWSSSDTSVATVDSAGKITAVKAGTTTITVKTADGGKTAAAALTVTAAAVSYPVTAQFGAWSGSGTVKATVNGDYSKFSKLTLGGNTVSAGNYTAASGSTVITLNENYLKTLADGTYTYRAEFTDGQSDAITLTVSGNGSGVPGTGDESAAPFFVSAAVMSLTGILALNAHGKRKAVKTPR